MSEIITNLDQAVAFLAEQFGDAPELALILGSGLGAFADSLGDAKRVSYGEIPHFAASKVSGHAGQLVVGTCGGVRLAVMSGRVHYYEGHSMEKVVFGARTLARWGVQRFCITNSAGGVDTDFSPGDLMLITDHLNLMGNNPLFGPNLPELGARFPDMSTTYRPALVELLARAADLAGIKVRRGVYAGLSGPTYETPAEIRMLRTIGANAVGMSTVPEAIALNHMRREVCGISCITNMAAGILDQPLDHKEVKETADRVKDEFIRLLEQFVQLTANRSQQ